MADDVDDIVLEPEVVIEPPVEEPPKTVTADEGIETLKAKLASETAAREAADLARQAADRRAQEAANAATQANTAKGESDLALVTNAIETIRGQQDLLETNLAAAAAAGDWTEHGKYTRQLSDNSAKLAALEQGKVRMETEAKEPKVTPITDPVEALAITLSAPSGAWVRAHPEYARDPAKFRQMVGADNLVQGQGIKPDTDEYFTRVEALLGIRKEVKEPENPLSEAAQTREASPPAAPVMRQTNGTGRVKLTAAQLEAAADADMTPEEYAKNLVALQKEGRVH